MISAKRIGELIKNPEKISIEEIEGLDKLVDKYPYATALRFLLLKGKAVNFHPDFEAKLEQSANFVSDRAYLYSFLQGENGVELLNDDADDSLEKSIIETTVEIKDVASAEHNEVVEEEVLEDDVKSEVELSDTIEKEIPRYDLVKEISGNVVPEEADVTVIKTLPEELSFVEWLKYKRTEGKSPDVNKIKKSESVPLVKVEASVNTKKLSKIDINQLLDKFIDAEPRISKPTEKLYTPEKTARQSFEEQESLVTETLARIHLLQKNYAKAIETYKRLILVYPEKKTYFATQIEEIRGLNTDKED